MYTVYRVENVERRGPYTGTYVNWMEEAHTPQSGRPGPKEDALGGARAQLGYASRFGFTSLEALQRWFSPAERETLGRYGFRVAVIEANQIWEGKRQCIYVEDYACRVRTIEFFNLPPDEPRRDDYLPPPAEWLRSDAVWYGVDTRAALKPAKVTRIPWVKPCFTAMTCKSLLRVSNTWLPPNSVIFATTTECTA